jgi:mono/diheme cytochrome c family protein
MRNRWIIGVSLSFAVAAGCSGGGGNASPGGPDSGLPEASLSPGLDASSETGNSHPKVLSTTSHASMIGLSADDSRIIVANRYAGTATVFSVDYTSDALPTLAKVAEIAVGGEPSAVAIHPDGDTAFVLSRLDQKVTKITGLMSTPVKAGEVAVGSEPTGLAMTPLGSTLYVANWIDGTLTAVKTDTMAVTSTVDLNAALAASPYPGAGLTSRPALAHPRAIAITNNGDMVEDDETIYVTEYYAQQKTPLAPDGSNADTNRVGVLYKIPLATMAASLIELPAMTDMGFKDHLGGVAGCFPNQIGAINIQGGFGYVISVCASPKAPIGLFNGPALAACTADSACPGAGTGSCGNIVGHCSVTTTMSCSATVACPGTETCTGLAGTCKTNCVANADCGSNGGACVPTTGSDPAVGGNCAPNLASTRTWTAPVVSIVDLGGNKTIATVNLNRAFKDYFDGLATPLPDDATRRMPLLPADVGFVPGTVTAYFAAYGADAVFRVDFDATYAASTIDSLGDAKNPFISTFSAAIDPSLNGQLPSGIAVAHATHTAGSTTRYAFTINDHTRNVTVLDLANAEIAGLSAGFPKAASASPLPTAQHDIDVFEGKRLFVTGLGRWSWKGQAWGGCSNCHGINDSLSDNVTWYLGRGPRQSPNLDATFIKGAAAKNDATDYRINSWEGIQDEMVDHEGGIRAFGGGVGAVVKDPSLNFSSHLDVPGQTGLNGSSIAVADPANPEGLATPAVLTAWPQILTWAKTIRTPRKPTNLDSAKVAAGQALFMGANCQGCHSGPSWTISTVFYQPDWKGVTNNKLKTLSWTSAVQQAGFPAALLPVSNTLPTPPTGLVYSGQTMRYSGNKANLYDQLTCAIRNVGTFNVAQAEAGIAELRGDMVTVAQGGEPDCSGFNIPSLLSSAVGAPYFHAGNALTLEGMFSTTFQAHYQALAADFLGAGDTARAEHVADLIQYILSIDGDTPAIAVPPLGPNGGVFCAAQ